MSGRSGIAKRGSQNEALCYPPSFNSITRMRKIIDKTARFMIRLGIGIMLPCFIVGFIFDSGEVIVLPLLLIGSGFVILLGMYGLIFLHD